MLREGAINVKQLIEILETHNPNSIVRVEVSDSYYDTDLIREFVYEDTYEEVPYTIIHGD